MCFLKDLSSEATFLHGTLFLYLQLYFNLNPYCDVCGFINGEDINNRGGATFWSKGHIENLCIRHLGQC